MNKHLTWLVLLGSDWKWEDQDGGIGSIGTVYRLKNDATVYVSVTFKRSLKKVG